MQGGFFFRYDILSGFKLVTGFSKKRVDVKGGKRDNFPNGSSVHTKTYAKLSFKAYNHFAIQFIDIFSPRGNSFLFFRIQYEISHFTYLLLTF